MKIIGQYAGQVFFDKFKMRATNVHDHENRPMQGFLLAISLPLFARRRHQNEGIHEAGDTNASSMGFVTGLKNW